MVVLAQNQPTPPSPIDLSDPNALFAALAAANSGAVSQDPAIVPLWVNRPAGNRTSTGISGRGFLERNDANPVLYEAPAMYTKGFAETQWTNLSDADKQEFADRAQKAGLWEPSDGAYGLFRAWAQAVGLAASYNEARVNDKDSWISPFEALQKLTANAIAGAAGTVNGFTGWRSQRNKQILKFNEQQVEETATAILQKELGRDPTDAELKAYTIAVNREAAKNPHIVTTRTRDTAFDAEGRPTNTETEQTVEGAPFDPSQMIEDMATGTEENEAFKAAAVYLPALVSALGSVV